MNGATSHCGGVAASGKIKHSGVAQLEERPSPKRVAAGSSPVTGAKEGLCVRSLHLRKGARSPLRSR